MLVGGVLAQLVRASEGQLRILCQCCLPADALNRLAPESIKYRHDDEGPDDMPGVPPSLSVAFRLMLPQNELCMLT